MAFWAASPENVDLSLAHKSRRTRVVCLLAIRARMMGHRRLDRSGFIAEFEEGRKLSRGLLSPREQEGVVLQDHLVTAQSTIGTLLQIQGQMLVVLRALICLARSLEELNT